MTIESDPEWRFRGSRTEWASARSALAVLAGVLGLVVGIYWAAAVAFAAGILFAVVAIRSYRKSDPN